MPIHKLVGHTQMSNKKQYIFNKTTDSQELDATFINQIKNVVDSQGFALLRGFDVDTAEKFGAFVDSFPGTTIDKYTAGNTPRTRINGAVFTSTDYPADYFISLHSELSYAKQWPTYLFFCCVTPPLVGGSTTIADNRKILEELPTRIRESFYTKGVTYIRNLGHRHNAMGKSWQQTFETEDRDIVQEYCSKNDIEYTWKSDGSLKISETRAGVITHVGTNEKVWFNQAEQFHPSTHPKDVYEALKMIYTNPEDMPQYACYGDGTPFSEADLQIIRDVLKENTIDEPWVKGNVLIIENELASHGRMPFKGDRKVLVAFSVAD
jgi:hypothetical protein